MAIVHKFGGTSVGCAVRISAVAQIVEHYHNAGTGTASPGTVVIVSAMSGVTNQLLAGAWAAAEGRERDFTEVRAVLLDRHLAVARTLLPDNQECHVVVDAIERRIRDLDRLYGSIAVLGELTARGRDHVAAFGEQLSAWLLAAVLRARGLRAEAEMATDLIVTDDHFGAALPLAAPTRARLQERLLPLVDQGVIPVVTGFIAANEAGVTTTLGRGGSDYTAALVGAGLDADEVWIWSDVDGILTADPNLVPAARTLRELSYAEASELAYYGADVLHPKTIRPVIEHTIPLRILNSFNPTDPGTLIVKTPSGDRERLPAIISTSGLSLIAVGSGYPSGTSDDSWTLADVALALQALSAGGVDVLMFSQSFSEHSLNLVVRSEAHARCLATLERAFADALTGGDVVLGTKAEVATVSVVGVPSWNATGTVSHAYAALGAQGTRVIAVAQAATENSVSFCIPEDQLGETVRFLHRELGLERGP